MAAAGRVQCRLAEGRAGVGVAVVVVVVGVG